MELSKAVESLIHNEHFKRVVLDLFIRDGKSALWENIREFEEQNLKNFNEKRAGTITKLKEEVHARLILEGFFNLILSDGEAAAEHTIKEDV